MKKIRILSGLMAVVMLLSLMAVNVFAADSGKVVLSDVPYDYGVVRLSDDWDELTTSERKTVFNIPQNVTEKLTTQALLKTILNNPYITEIFLYDTLEKGIEVKDFRFHFTELFSRSDVRQVLRNYINELSVRLDLDSRINLDTTLEDFRESEYSLISDYIVCVHLYEYLNNIVTPSNNLRYGIVQIQTLGGAWLEGKTNRAWSNVLGGELATSIAEMNYELNYPNSVKLEEKSPLYNCHCYAWHTEYFSYDKYIWIESEDAQTYLNDSCCSLIPRVTSGCKVVYFDPDGEEMLHSGSVVSVSGNNIYVISKMGNCGVYRHLLRDCSYYEDSEGYINYYWYEEEE